MVSDERLVRGVSRAWRRHEHVIKNIKSSVGYLVGEKIADPRRLGISGGSYCGYMTWRV
jgi:dipeptidyl aminopeptidase/acylaminoacyl peptidase